VVYAFRCALKALLLKREINYQLAISNVNPK